MMARKIILVLLINLLMSNSAFAHPNCQQKYDSDKRALPSLQGMCNVCHISPNGGGPTNEFGDAFKVAGFMITDALVAKFPNLFQKPNNEPSSNTSSGGQEALKPIIKRIKPTKVKINVQSMASIIGKNFTDGAKTFIDGNEILTTFKSKAQLIINFVLNTVGVHEVKVQNPDGQESNTINIKAK